MKIKIIILALFFSSCQVLADPYQYVNPWSEKKFQDFHDISFKYENFISGTFFTPRVANPPKSPFGPPFSKFQESAFAPFSNK